jgi:hypothetical protein
MTRLRADTTRTMFGPYEEALDFTAVLIHTSRKCTVSNAAHSYSINYSNQQFSVVSRVGWQSKGFLLQTSVVKAIVLASSAEKVTIGEQKGSRRTQHSG